MITFGAGAGRDTFSVPAVVVILCTPLGNTFTNTIIVVILSAAFGNAFARAVVVIILGTGSNRDTFSVAAIVETFAAPCLTGIVRRAGIILDNT